MEIVLLLQLLAVVIVLLIVWGLKQLTYTPPGNIPPIVKGLPLIGSAIQFGISPLKLFKDAYEKHGSVFTLKVFHQHMIFFAGPEAHDFYFKMDEETFNAAEAYKFTVPVFGKGVVYDGPPDVLIHERKLVSNGLNLRRFKEYVGIIEQETAAYFAEKWGDEPGESDLFDCLNECTVRTSTHCIQGAEIRSMSDEFVKLYWTLDEALSAIAFFFPNLPLPSNWARDKARKRMEAIFTEVIEKRRANPNSHEEHQDLIQTLVESTYPSGAPVENASIVGMMIALLLAGQHTSNVTGTWTGLNLVHNTDVWDKCVKEQEAFGDGPLTFDSMKNSKYLDACIRETLRLRPPIICIMRRVMKDTKYKGYDIPKGTLVAVSPFLSMRLDSVFPKPDEFEPERMMPPRNENKQSGAYLAFGAGRHACIGESFALLQVKTIWAWIIRNYDITPVGPMPLPNFQTMVVGPIKPVTVKYRKKRK